jgi:hypothetical protein
MALLKLIVDCHYVDWSGRSETPRETPQALNRRGGYPERPRKASFLSANQQASLTNINNKNHGVFYEKSRKYFNKNDYFSIHPSFYYAIIISSI